MRLAGLCAGEGGRAARHGIRGHRHSNLARGRRASPDDLDQRSASGEPEDQAHGQECELAGGHAGAVLPRPRRHGRCGAVPRGRVAATVPSVNLGRRACVDPGAVRASCGCHAQATAAPASPTSPARSPPLPPPPPGQPVPPRPRRVSRSRPHLRPADDAGSVRSWARSTVTAFPPPNPRTDRPKPRSQEAPRSALRLRMPWICCWQRHRGG